MLKLKYKSYDRGNVRCYFTNSKMVYCVQPGHNYLPELIVCTQDGEPIHQMEDGIKYTLINMPADGDDWRWCEVLDYFTRVVITSNNQLIRRFNQLFEVQE